MPLFVLRHYKTLCCIMIDLKYLTRSARHEKIETTAIYQHAEDDNTSKEGLQHYGDICDPDFDNDGLVSLDDFAIWRTYFRQPVPDAPEYIDVSGDNLIDLSDFAIWRMYFRSAPGPGIGD